MSLETPARSFIEAIITGAPLARKLGVTLTAVGSDTIELALPFSPENVTVGETVHGGTIASLIDIAGAGLSSLAADPARHTRGSTTSLVINYLRPAIGVDLAAKGTILRAGRDTVISEIEIAGPDGKLVAKGTVTSRLA
jgi:uncharacterized protein (TIGR00369 family)